MEERRGIDLLLKELDEVLEQKIIEMKVLAAEIEWVKSWKYKVQILKNEIDSGKIEQ